MVLGWFFWLAKTKKIYKVSKTSVKSVTKRPRNRIPRIPDPNSIVGRVFHMLLHIVSIGSWLLAVVAFVELLAVVAFVESQ